MTDSRATGLSGDAPPGGWAEGPARLGSSYELRGTWAFVTWGSLVTIALVPFTNVFLPKTNHQYSVMSVTWLFFWACLLLSPRVLRWGFTSVVAWMLVLFGTRYVYGSLLSTLPEQMANSTQSMVRPMLWAWVLAAALRGDRFRRLACDVFLSGSALAGALHLMGIGTDSPIVEALGSQRISAFEQNANVLGVIYATAFLIAVSRVIRPGSGRGWVRRLLYGGMGVLNAAGILLTGSRTAALFVALGVVALVAIEARRARWSAPATLAAVLFVGSVLGGGLVQSVLDKRSERVSVVGVGSEDRARMAPVLVDQFLRSPIIGLGPENYRVELGHRSGTGDPDVGIVAHNQLAMFAVEMGLFGIVPFLAICGLLLVQSWRVREAEGGLPFALALACVATACTTANIAFHWHFHFIVGLVAAAHSDYLARRTGGPSIVEEEA